MENPLNMFQDTYFHLLTHLVMKTKMLGNIWKKKEK